MMQSPSHNLHTSLQRWKDDLSPTLSRFPEEIVRLILERLGKDSRSEAMRLVRVSRLVHGWLLPILYETIRIEDASDLHQIRTNLTAHPELAPHVHNICLELASYRGCGKGRVAIARDVSGLFSQCPHIRSIYLPNSTSLTFHQNIVQLPRLEELHYGSWALWPTDDISAFRTLTHLRMDTTYSIRKVTWAPLRAAQRDALPQLTHLAFGCGDGYATAQFVREVLAARPRLVMLVVILCLEEGGDHIAFEDIADPRLCVLTSLSSLDDMSSITQWEDAVRGKQSIWGKAEAVIKGSRAHGGHGMAVGPI